MFSHILKLGSSGFEVGDLSDMLARLGYPIGREPQKFTKETEASVKLFQKRHELVIDGIVGPKTTAALIAAANAVLDRPAPIEGSLTEEKLRQELVALWIKDIGMKETGFNRGAWVDAINKVLHVPEGSAYCIGALLVRGVKVLCEKYKLKIPKKMMDASTQNFWRNAPLEFKNEKPAFAKLGDFGILRNFADAGKGHAFGFRLPETSASKQETVEYNTDLSGSREGDGCYTGIRSQSGTSSKEYLGSVDVVAWIMSENPEAFSVSK